jgi:hypothetical protein
MKVISLLHIGQIIAFWASDPVSAFCIIVLLGKNWYFSLLSDHLKRNSLESDPFNYVFREAFSRDVPSEVLCEILFLT